MLREHFNPRTPCGVRPELIHNMAEAIRYFNPRTPCGVRPAAESESENDMPVISIHAPRAGCDEEIQRVLDDRYVFQSTHPVRGATAYRQSSLQAYFQFQSTHPVRGATNGKLLTPPDYRYFNPRTPCGVRPRLTHPRTSKVGISIHAPRAGCDPSPRRGRWLPTCPISIHAPRAGCDVVPRGTRARVADFNPRTPCGVRRGQTSGNTETGLFQSTHPVRGATAYHRRDRRRGFHFNPRTPCGVRRQTCTTWFAPIFATLPNQMYVCLHYTCFTTLFQPKTWFSAVFQRCEAPRESMSAPASHRVKASAAPPAHRSAWRRYAQRGSDSYSQDCKSAGCPSPGQSAPPGDA